MSSEAYVTEHLQQYGCFSDDVIEAVSRAAALHAPLSFREIADRYDLASGTVRISQPGRRAPLEYVQFIPEVDYDADQAAVYFAPINTPVDASLTMQAAQLFAADPTKQLFVVGAPAAIGNRSNRVRPRDLPAVWRGNFTPTVRPVLQHLGSIGITAINPIGYSYGASSAAAAGEVSPDYNIAIQRGVFVDPATFVKRSLLTLGRDFIGSKAELASYREASASPAYAEAIFEADPGIVRYAAGLARLSNIALVHALTKKSLEHDIAWGLVLNDDMSARLVWGTESRIAPATAAAAATASLMGRFKHRVRGMAVPGMSHAGICDINLHAALVLENLRN